ncbi:MAG: hypothetical protein ACE5R6_20865 [Candidatus Heimdallarchaeota archaeon]
MKVFYTHNITIVFDFYRKRAIKNLLEVERFSSQKLETILQDFFALCVVTTLESLLSQADDQAIRRGSQEKSLKHVYKVNKSVSYHAVGEYLVKLLLDRRRPISEVIRELRHLFRLACVPIRPGRRFCRKELTPRQEVRFLRYKKRVWA